MRITTAREEGGARLSDLYEGERRRSQQSDRSLADRLPDVCEVEARVSERCVTARPSVVVR